MARNADQPRSNSPWRREGTPDGCLGFPFHNKPDIIVLSNDGRIEHGTLKGFKTRAEQTPPEWLKVGAQLGELVNIWAGRSDIVAYVGPGAGDSAPACFNPPMAEVEVDVAIAFGAAATPENIGDIRVRSVQFDYPRASGAIFHEALHARYSRYDLLKAA
jgi:hypothetical protein